LSAAGVQERKVPDLDQKAPFAEEDTLGVPLFDVFNKRRICTRDLHAQFASQTCALARRRPHRLDKDLGRLGDHQPDEEFDDFLAQVGRRRVEEVFVDIDKHAGGAAERVERSLEAFRTGAGGRRGEGRESRADVEDDGRLLVRE
jgi:hypothetical protein